MSNKLNEEEKRKWMKRGLEFHLMIREFMAKCFTVQELLDAINLLHSYITEEGLHRAAFLGEAKQQFLQALEDEIKKRKTKDIGLV